MGRAAHFGSWTSVQADDAHPHGLEYRLCAVACIELLVDRREMVLHSLLTDVHLLRHLGCRAAVGDELEHLFFARGDHTVVLGLSTSIETAQLIEHARRELR